MFCLVVLSFTNVVLLCLVLLGFHNVQYVSVVSGSVELAVVKKKVKIN